jgi:hypothetical protein
MDLMTITKREKWHKFYPLALDGSKYLTWRLDCISYLTAAGADFVVEKNEQETETTTTITTTRQRRTNTNTDTTQEQEISLERRKLIANARNIINDHVHPRIKQNYIHLSDPTKLWNALKVFDNRITMMLPAALQQWNNLRVSNFDNVNAYNNQMQALVATIKACGQGGLVTGLSVTSTHY